MRVDVELYAGVGRQPAPIGGLGDVVSRRSSLRPCSLPPLSRRKCRNLEGKKNYSVGRLSRKDGFLEVSSVEGWELRSGAPTSPGDGGKSAKTTVTVSTVVFHQMSLEIQTGSCDAERYDQNRYFGLGELCGWTDTVWAEDRNQPT